jgi:histidyl-tRNA synthetase
MKTLKGFREFYPDPVPSKDAWSFGMRNWIFQSWKATARKYGFLEYDGPPLEPLDLYTRKSGDEIVGQLYNFVDKGDREVALRPEMTPTFARMVSQASTQYKKPMKWFSIPQLFRYERNQRGRLREHFQLNADIVGESSLAADAELIAFLIDVLRDLGLSHNEFRVKLSSRSAWIQFYQKHHGQPDKQYQFFQAVDKMDRLPEDIVTQQFEDVGIPLHLVKEFISSAQPVGDLIEVVNHLSHRGLSDYIQIDYQIIRGLAYYTGIVFEAFDCAGKFRAIAGGGRYDKLIHLLSDSKVDLPALGFGMGDVVLTELLIELQKAPNLEIQADVFFAIEDESFRPQSLAHIQWFRDKGHSVHFPLTPTKPDKQFKLASELNARCLVYIDPLNPHDLTFKILTTRQKLTGPRELISTLL